MICTLFQLGTRYPNHVNQVAREQRHNVFTLTCGLFHIPSGRVIGEGIGACSTLEYRYRVQTEQRTYPNGNTVPAKYTAYDFYNTALKLGKKRSLVDAVLTVTGAREIFTQDLEDDPEKSVHDAESQPARRPLASSPQRSRTPQPAHGAHETLTGVVERAWPNDCQGKRYYFAKVNGQQLQTTDQELSERLLVAANRVAIATVEPAPNKPGKFYVKALDVPELPKATAADGDAPLDDDPSETEAS